MGRIKIWIDSSRPKTLWAAVAPVIIGTAMAYGDGKFHFIAAFISLLAAILIQIGTNYANDYFDYKKGADTKERIGPPRATGAGLIRPQTMRDAFIIAFSLAFVIGLYLICRAGWPILLIGIISIISGILYTGGPYPLGYKGLGDIFVLIFFGPVAVGGTYYVQALEITKPVIIAGLSPGLISTALLTVNNLRDIHSDGKAGKKTLAVRFGAVFTRIEYIVAIVVACFMPAILIVINPDHPYVLAAMSVFLFALPSIRAVLFDEISPRLNKVLADTGKILLIYSIIFALGWIF